MAPKRTIYKYCEKCGEQVAFVLESPFPPLKTTIRVKRHRCGCDGQEDAPQSFSPSEVSLVDNLPEHLCPHCKGSGQSYNTVCSPCAGTGLKPLGDRPQFTIHKLVLDGDITQNIEVETHALAEFLDVHMQGEALCVWARVNKSLPKLVHRFRVYGTGWDMATPQGQYLGTAHSDWLVWHVFYLGATRTKRGN